MSVKKSRVAKASTQAKAKSGDKGSLNEVVLLCGVGTSPAVLTETVWAMVTEMGVVPDKVVAITTTTGAKQIRENLRESGVWDRMCAALKKKRFNIEGKLSFGSQSSICIMSMGSSDLEDLATPKENMAAADSILEKIRSYTTNPSCTLYASLAGGRKTMSALMLSCMSLLAREEDHVLHVLVNKPFENGVVPDFFYPDGGTYYRKVKGEKGEKCTVKPKIDLIDLPFVKVRGLYENKFKHQVPTYSMLVKEAQLGVDDAIVSEPEIRFDFKSAKVFINEKEVSLSPPEYMMFAILLTKRPDSFDKLTELLVGFHSRAIADNNQDFYCRFIEGPRFAIFHKDDCSKVIESLKGKLREIEGFSLFVDAVVKKRKCDVTYPPEKISADIQELEAQFK